MEVTNSTGIYMVIKFIKELFCGTSYKDEELKLEKEQDPYVLLYGRTKEQIDEDLKHTIDINIYN